MSGVFHLVGEALPVQKSLSNPDLKFLLNKQKLSNSRFPKFHR